MNLDELGLKHGTDKASDGHDYLNVYEEFLAPYRNSARAIMEIGVREGPSVRLWRDYFTRAQVIGVDVKEECRAHADERIAIEIGNQGDPRFVRQLMKTYKPDIVMDDGSHIWKHQIDTFRVVFPLLNPGGLFVCEDLHTSRINAFPKYGTAYTVSTAAYFGQLAAQVGAEGVIYAAMKDEELTAIREQVEWIRFGRRFVAVKKKSQ